MVQTNGTDNECSTSSVPSQRVLKYFLLVSTACVYSGVFFFNFGLRKGGLSRDHGSSVADPNSSMVPWMQTPCATALDQFFSSI